MADDYELIGYMAFGVYEGRSVALHDYAGRTELDVKKKVLDCAHREGFRGPVELRLELLGWVIKPIYSNS